MDAPSPDARANAIYRGILQVIANHRTRFFSEPSSEGFTIWLSVVDARMLDEMSQRRGGFAPVSQIEDGDTGTLVGLPFMADAGVRPGRVYLGYRIDALDPRGVGR